jgi:hypothetical protein
MATFEITGPDGSKYRVTGDNPEDAARAVAAIAGASPAKPTAADRIAAAKSGTLEAAPESLRRAAEADQIAEDQMRLGSAGPAGGIAVKAAQGLPFVGEWIDEGLNALDPGRGDRMRDIQGAMDRQHPRTAIASQIGGGILGSIPLAVGAVGAAGQAATRFGQAATGAALGASGGAAEGALAGAGAANDGDRIAGAKRGAAIGGGLGFALGGIAPAIGEGVTALAKRVKRLDVRTIANELGVSPAAARMVKSALVDDDLDAAVLALSKQGDNAMLGDAGMGSAAMLDAAAQTGGKALRVADSRVQERATQAGVRLSQKLDNILGPADGVKAAARDISQRTAKTRQALYDRAYSAPIDYSGPGRKIEEVLSRVPDRTLRAAIDEANEAMKAAGVQNRQIMAEIAEDGTVAFREMPNVQQLDELKKALGAVARTETDQFGRLTAAGIRAQKLAGELRDAVSDAVPVYRNAVKAGGDKIAEDQALDLGRRILSSKTKFEDAREIMQGASLEAKAAARRGMREQIEDTLSNVRRTITDPNVDAREAMSLVKEMSSRANMKKARLILGTGAKALFDELEQAEAALALRAAMARNSATAIRTQIQRTARDEVAPGVVRSTAGKLGNPLDAAQSITETLFGIDPQSMNEAERKMMAEIADALTGIRGQDAQRALSVVKAALEGQPMKDADAQLIGKLVSGSAAGGGYQAATQPQRMAQPR